MSETETTTTDAIDAFKATAATADTVCDELWDAVVDLRGVPDRGLWAIGSGEEVIAVHLAAVQERQAV